MDAPGYRDRIVHIQMQHGEGGFAFDMPRETIATLDHRGRFAGEVIAKRFMRTGATDLLNPDVPGFHLNWSNYRFVRLRIFLAGVEVTSTAFTTNWQRDVSVGKPGTADHYPGIEHIVAHSGGPLPQYVGYRFRAEQDSLALRYAADLANLARNSHATPVSLDLVAGKSTSPRPKSTLRMRPARDSDPGAGT